VDYRIFSNFTIRIIKLEYVNNFVQQFRSMDNKITEKRIVDALMYFTSIFIVRALNIKIQKKKSDNKVYKKFLPFNLYL
jgi:hypothetical protein